MPARPRAAVFDAYGTLLDIHSAVRRHAARLGDAAASVSALWRAKQLEASWILTATGGYEGFDALTERALDHALAAHGIQEAALRGDLLSAYRALDAFPDAVAVLERLRASGIPAAILSNGEPETLGAAVKAAGIDGLLEVVLSAHPLRLFKPHPAVYALALGRFACRPTEIAFISSNAWDAHGATRVGFRTFWVNRAGTPPEYGLDRRATILPTLNALPDHLLA